MINEKLKSKIKNLSNKVKILLLAGQFEQIINLLDVNPFMYALDLENAQIGDNEAELLAKVIASNNTLKYINLEGNKISNMGAVKLGEAIAVNKTLSYLSLQENRIDEEGVKFLDKLIAQNDTLHKINLIHNTQKYLGTMPLEQITKDVRLFSFYYDCNCGDNWEKFLQQASTIKENQIKDQYNLKNESLENINLLVVDQDIQMTGEHHHDHPWWDYCSIF